MSSERHWESGSIKGSEILCIKFEVSVCSGGLGGYSVVCVSSICGCECNESRTECLWVSVLQYDSSLAGVQQQTAPGYVL